MFCPAIMAQINTNKDKLLSVYSTQEFVNSVQMFSFRAMLNYFIAIENSMKRPICPGSKLVQN